MLRRSRQQQQQQQQQQHATVSSSSIQKKKKLLAQKLFDNAYKRLVLQTPFLWKPTATNDNDDGSGRYDDENGSGGGGDTATTRLNVATAANICADKWQPFAMINGDIYLKKNAQRICAGEYVDFVKLLFPSQPYYDCTNAYKMARLDVEKCRLEKMALTRLYRELGKNIVFLKSHFRRNEFVRMEKRLFKEAFSLDFHRLELLLDSLRKITKMVQLECSGNVLYVDVRSAAELENSRYYYVLMANTDKVLLRIFS